MNDEAKVRLVVTHAQCGGRNQRLERVVAQGVLEPLTLSGLQTAGVGRNPAAVTVDELHGGSETFSIGNGQGVDDPRALEPRQVIDHPGEPLDRREGVHDGQLQTAPGQRTTQDQGRLAELGGHVQGHPFVGGRRGRQDRSSRVECLKDVGDPSVVGTEVVTPVGHGMGLVDDQKPEPAGHLVKHPAAEPGVGQPLGRDQQNIELVGTQRSLNLRPGIDV